MNRKLIRPDLSEIKDQMTVRGAVRARKPVPPDGMDALRTLTSALGHYDPEAADNSPQANYRKAVRLTAQLGSLVATYGRVQAGGGPIQPDPALGQAAKRIGEGDLTVRAQVAGKDEIARLASEFNTMVERLEVYRKSSLGELLEAQTAMQAAIDSLPDPVLVVSVERQLLNLNKAAERALEIHPEQGSAALDAVFTPTTRPVSRLSRGPPELPALIGASVCSMSGPSREVTAEAMPRVPVKRNPHGWPNAPTGCPTAGRALHSRSGCGGGVLIPLGS